MIRFVTLLTALCIALTGCAGSDNPNVSEETVRTHEENPTNIEAIDAEICEQAVERGWGDSKVSPDYLATQCTQKLAQSRYWSNHSEGHLPCMHGGIPRICSIDLKSDTLIIWWSRETKYSVQADDRPKVDPHIVWFDN